MKRVSVVGLGYIGLPTAVIAAESGFEVFGFDVDKKKVQRINAGDPTIVEPEIASRLRTLLDKKSFVASPKLQDADCFIVAVPTPFKSDKVKKAELAYVYSAAKSVAKVLKEGNLVILESTVPVGSTQKFKTLLEAETGMQCSKDFFVAYCPERVLPGRIFTELVSNDRIIGGVCEKSSAKAKSFYKKFVKGEMHVVSDKTAEMVKLVENSSRDIQIAFANQVAAMCEESKINPFEVIELANKHPRVNVLKPGCGVGGHCIAVDPWFLVEKFPKTSKLLKVAREVNDLKPACVASWVLKEASSFKKEHKRVPNILALGLTFKPNVDDLRNSPAIEIAKDLKNRRKLKLAVCEPHVEDVSLNDMGFEVKTSEDGLLWADIILILVAHEKFEVVKKQLREKIVIDTCGLMYRSKADDNKKFFKGACLTKDDITKDEQLPDIFLVP